MIYTTKKPCKECPFVLERTKGYIGDYDSGDDLHRLASSDVEFPCHKTTNSDDPVSCTGIQLYRKGICKRMRSKDAAKNMQDVVALHAETETAVAPFQLGAYHEMPGASPSPDRQNLFCRNNAIKQGVGHERCISQDQKGEATDFR